jgi:polyvinyl alcohol dehydrogenase (cytochrome)
VFVGGLDGVMHAFAAATGEELWNFSTWRDFDTVNTLDGNAEASGGSIDVHGPLLAQDLMIVQSGYGTFGQKGGNALLVFKLDAEAP